MDYERTVHAERLTDCPFSVAQDYAEEYLHHAERGDDRALVYAGPLQRRVVFRFGTRNDSMEPGRPHDEIVLDWYAETSLLPDFTGTLRMRIAMPGTRFVLDGRYVPPGGALGAVFDRLIGSRIASATADALLAGIADRAKTWRSGIDRFSRPASA
ncbi:MAG: hypothetical protein NVSMB5_24770 [Candidatus Velthaea sp.]